MLNNPVEIVIRIREIFATRQNMSRVLISSRDYSEIDQVGYIVAVQCKPANLLTVNTSWHYRWDGAVKVQFTSNNGQQQYNKEFIEAREINIPNIAFGILLTKCISEDMIAFRNKFVFVGFSSVDTQNYQACLTFVNRLSKMLKP